MGRRFIELSSETLPYPSVCVSFCPGARRKAWTIGAIAAGVVREQAPVGTLRQRDVQVMVGEQLLVVVPLGERERKLDRRHTMLSASRCAEHALPGGMRGARISTTFVRTESPPFACRQGWVFCVLFGAGLPPRTPTFLAGRFAPAPPTGGTKAGSPRPPPASDAGCMRAPVGHALGQTSV